MKDIYFDEYGFYLGVDDRPTNNVRIMPRSVWYALGGANGLIVNVESVILDSNSALFLRLLWVHMFFLNLLVRVQY